MHTTGRGGGFGTAAAANASNRRERKRAPATEGPRRLRGPHDELCAGKRRVGVAAAPAAWHWGSVSSGPVSGTEARGRAKAPGARNGPSLRPTPHVPLRKGAASDRLRWRTSLRPSAMRFYDAYRDVPGTGFEWPRRCDLTVCKKTEARARGRAHGRVPGPSCAAAPRWASSARGRGGTSQGVRGAQAAVSAPP